MPQTTELTIVDIPSENTVVHVKEEKKKKKSSLRTLISFFGSLAGETRASVLRIAASPPPARAREDEPREMNPGFNCREVVIRRVE